MRGFKTMPSVFCWARSQKNNFFYRVSKIRYVFWCKTLIDCLDCTTNINQTHPMKFFTTNTEYMCKYLLTNTFMIRRGFLRCWPTYTTYNSTDVTSFILTYEWCHDRRVYSSTLLLTIENCLRPLDTRVFMHESYMVNRPWTSLPDKPYLCIYLRIVVKLMTQHTFFCQHYKMLIHSSNHAFFRMFVDIQL